MSVGFGIVGCGYVGSAVAAHFRLQGHEVVGTTTSPERLGELCDLVDHPRIYRAGDPMADSSFLDHVDGVLIAMAPTTATFEEDQYEKVYGQAVPTLVDALRQRQGSRPLHVSYLSSAGVYGDQSGAICNELTPPDCSNTANALLASAESEVLSLNDASIQACVLRLGGIYGPGKDIPSYIRSAAGQSVPKNGNHINAWVHLRDIIRGVDFAFEKRLQGIYNLVDDLQFTRRQLSNALCDDHGLPPVIWDNHDRPGARIFNARVSNARLREIGFEPSVVSMLEPVAA
jgi:nucleoside-diphosphate-sugar epimerase